MILTTKKYTVSIGLEVHAQIASNIKLFSSSKAESFGYVPNTSINIFDLGAPGALPLINAEPVLKAVKVCKALNMQINPVLTFDRKHYFYFDLPCGYQITQFYSPIGKNGYLPFWTFDKEMNVKILQLHLETDAGKAHHKDNSIDIDLNRSGVALMEIITEPDLHSAEEVVFFLKMLQNVLRDVDGSNADMDKGQFRADVNISVSKTSTLGTRNEIKNLNSFSSITKAIEYEVKRQIDVLEAGGVIKQETRAFDLDTNTTISLRRKETSAGYCYMPDPDIPKIRIKQDIIDRQKVNTTLLPYNLCSSWIELGLDNKDSLALVDNTILRQLFSQTFSDSNNEFKRKVAKYILGPVAEYLNEHGEYCSIETIEEIVQLIHSNIISHMQSKTILAHVCTEKITPKQAIEKLGIKQISDNETLRSIIMQVIKDNPNALAKYKAGKIALKDFFIGRVMKETKGQANPVLLTKLTEEILNKDELL